MCIILFKMPNNKKKKKKPKSTKGTSDSCENITLQVKEPGYNKKYPFVSVCTPTFNRRPFFTGLIKCFNNQKYPKDRMEWIIVDDGTDKIKDLVEDIPQVRYFEYDEKMTLGKKRNLMHSKCRGEIIVYMDDDDYYPSERVSHSVEMLQAHPHAMCAGSSEIYLYFKHISKLYQFGPYGPNHATAGTFAFRKKLLDSTHYEDQAALAEEKAFLKNYTIPFVQLEPKKVILVISHEHNTFDKRKLLDNQSTQYCKPSNRTLDEFIKEDDQMDFYINQIDSLLKDYAPGRPEMKPDVLKQIAQIEEDRRKMMEKKLAENNKQITVQRPGEKPMVLNQDQTLALLREQHEVLNKMQQDNTNLQQHCAQLQHILHQRDSRISELETRISELENLLSNLKR